jgi:hypothetical protein
MREGFSAESRFDGLVSEQIRLHPAMTGNDLTVVVDQHRIGEPEPLDAFGHFAIAGMAASGTFALMMG